MKYSARLILLFSLTAFLAMTGLCAADSNPEQRENYQAYSKPLRADSREYEETANSFQAPATDPGNFQEFKLKEKDIAEIYEKHYGKAEGLSDWAPVEKKDECDNPLKVEYYFSFSMPESSINSAVQDALSLRKKCVKVEMKLRGLVENNLKKTIMAFYRIAKANPEDLPIEIDPKKFKKNNIQQVPTVLIGQKRFVGDMRLAGIIRNLETIQEGKVASAYSIKEEDIAEMMKRKIPKLEEAARKYAASGEVLKKFNLTRYDGQFARAEKKRVYYIDPTYTVPEDIKDHQGAVVVRAGQTFNPLDTVSVGKYIFINGNRPEEVDMALKGNYRQIILVSGDALKLAKKHRVHFYHVDDQMMRLFRIERLPLTIEQEGKLIRATEYPI
jgi:conjugal transfer pilus assembly protein TraW